MSAHKPILPAMAIEHVQEAGLSDQHAVLADFAAAGLIKTYALVRETIPPGAPAEVIRDALIPAEVWQRIVEAQKTEEALSGRTVRIPGSELVGGLPEVRLTGISFSEASLMKVLQRYCASPAPAPLAVRDPQSADAEPEALAAAVPAPPGPIIPPDAITISVAQAMRALGLGRTRINDMMNDGTLVRLKSGRRTLITVESVKRLIG